MATLGRTGGTALIVIDLQVDVTAACWQAADVLERTAALLAGARAAGIPVLHVQHSEPSMPIGSPGWQLHDEVAPLPGEPVVHKTYRDAFAGTELDALLAGAGVDTLLVAGAQSDFCIRSTCQAAAVRGYDVTLVSDCHTTEDAIVDGIAITAEQVIAHHTMYWGGLTYPGQRFAATTQTEVLAGIALH